MTSQLPAILPRIAVIEDDSDLLDSTLEYLLALGYHAWGVCSAEDFYNRFSVDVVDVVVLDIGLPGEDGLGVVRHLCASPRLTVIIVSARDTLDDRLAGLKAGADRYLVKPVNLAELVANIETVWRRSTHPHFNHPAEQLQEEKTKAGHWHLSKQDWCLTGPKGNSINLTAREFYLLNCLFEAKGEIVTKCSISDTIIGSRVFNGCERLDVLLARLRKKCVANLGLSLPIKTVNQIGYVFTAPALIE